MLTGGGGRAALQSGMFTVEKLTLKFFGEDESELSAEMIKFFEDGFGEPR